MATIIFLLYSLFQTTFCHHINQHVLPFGCSCLYPCLCSLCVSNPINIALDVHSTTETLVLSHSVPLAPRSAGIPSPGSFISLHSGCLTYLLLVVVIRGDSCTSFLSCDVMCFTWFSS
eukprot:302859_1